MMLVSKTHGAYSCVSYQSAVDRTQHWTVGWVRSTSVTPVLPTPSPSRAGWIGAWIRSGSRIAIGRGPRGKFKISGEAIYPAAESAHNGVIRATAAPENGMLQFADNGTDPFDQASADAGDCLIPHVADCGSFGRAGQRAVRRRDGHVHRLLPAQMIAPLKRNDFRLNRHLA
jgi:hypothetical protein